MSGYLHTIALLSAYPRAAHAAHAYSRSAYAPFRSAEASAPQRTSVLECLHEPYPFNQHEQHAGQQRGHLEDIRMRMEERIAAKLSYQTDLARDYAGQTGTTSYQTHAYSDHMQNQQPRMGGELIRPIASEAEYHDAINQAAAANRVVVIKIVGKFCRACRVLEPKFQRVAQQWSRKNVDFCTISYEQNGQFIEALGVTEIPTVQIFRLDAFRNIQLETINDSHNIQQVVALLRHYVGDDHGEAGYIGEDGLHYGI